MELSKSCCRRAGVDRLPSQDLGACANSSTPYPTYPRCVPRCLQPILTQKKEVVVRLCISLSSRVQTPSSSCPLTYLPFPECKSHNAMS